MDIYYIDGTFVPSGNAVIPVTDLVVLRGMGAFDFMRTYNGKPFCLNAHLQRLEISSRKIGLFFPWTIDTLAQHVLETLSRNSHKESNIRIIVTGGTSPDFMTHQNNPRLIIMVSPLAETPEKFYSDGISIVTRTMDRTMTGIKSINYVQAALSLEYARNHNAQESVYLDAQGRVFEGTTSNIFAVSGDTVMTPGTGILPGVTRQAVLDMIRPYVVIQVRDIFLPELLSADEVFISSTNKGIVPVVRVDDVKIGDGKPGPKVLHWIRRFPDFVQTYDAPLASV